MKIQSPTPEMNSLLQRCGSQDLSVAQPAFHEFAIAVTTPIRSGVLKGDILDGIYERTKFEYGQAVEYPIDSFNTSSNQDDFCAYVSPGFGRPSERFAVSDYLSIVTYPISNAYDWTLRYIKQARWDVVSRGLEVMRAGFTLKLNRDGWHVILAAAEGRNLVIYDENATAGLFTKRLLSLMDITMTRRAGGNTTSTNRGKMTDLYISVEGAADPMSWDLTQVPDAVRLNIYNQNGVTKIGPYTIHDLVELGEGQEFQNYWDDTLGGTMPTDKKEICIGFDLSNRDAFVMPIRQELEIFEDMTMHRQQRAGVYGHMEIGFASLNSLRVLAGAF